MHGTDLQPRQAPQQARSKATIEKILRVSAELLDEVGIDGFNTNLLAERAGIGVRAIYRYFPNKFAIVIAMAEELRHAERAWVGDLSKLSEYDDWRQAVDRSIDGYYNAARTQRGYTALLAATRAIPHIHEINEQESRKLQAELAAGLRSLGVSLDKRHLDALCRTVIESAEKILDSALRSPPAEAKLLVRELKLMITNLLAAYLE
ncbi:MAG TPA: TetR/AcrR family transcriptional regulator [Rhizomicrobium sp.]|jgi:AcrR family transcriptional regulator|nr:TetR/AcrR family transcriptional regulator [Rhizomicrobium sp.]